MNTTKDIADKARYLRNAAPQLFDDFVAAIDKYTVQQASNLIHTTENIHLAQGHAQQCVKFLEALREVRKNG